MIGAVGMRLGGSTGDRYELRRSLGSGAFGDAWQAYDHDEASVVVVKLLHPSTDPDDVLREAQAQLQRRLSAHDRIVAIRNVELGVNPTSFVVSELIPGGSIEDVLAVRRPTVRETHRWLRDALEALAHAHRWHVLHRDIKPSNMLLGADGHALLTDFGVAEDSLRRAQTPPGMYPLTFPPEFLTSQTTEQTDLWLVGFLGWQLLVGVRPNLADAHAGRVELAHRRSPEVPIAFSRAVAMGLEPDPQDRPDSAERWLDVIVRLAIHAGWHDVTSSDPDVVRAWKADEAGGEVEVEIRRKRRGGFRIVGRAPAGSRLSSRRDVSVTTEAAANEQARAWLQLVVRGERL